LATANRQKQKVIVTEGRKRETWKRWVYCADLLEKKITSNTQPQFQEKKKENNQVFLFFEFGKMKFWNNCHYASLRHFSPFLVSFIYLFFNSKQRQWHWISKIKLIKIFFLSKHAALHIKTRHLRDSQHRVQAKNHLKECEMT
jgi:hypothetical protein